MGRHLFGPVASRRFGASLGIDPLPMKTCTFDCPYCEIGRPTSHLTLRREMFVPVEDLLEEVAERLAGGIAPEVITVSGSGEPTLYAGLGALERGLRRITPLPLLLLTNGALLFDPRVREEARGFDIVIPSLDAGREDTWRKVNRPHPDMDYRRYLEGLEAMARERRGRCLLEVMLVAGVNDAAGEIAALAEAIARIRPDAVQLNTVARPPLDPALGPVSAREMERIAGVLGAICPVEVVSPGGRSAHVAGGTRATEQLMPLIARRPVTAEEAAAAIGVDAAAAQEMLDGLVRAGRIERLPEPGGGTRVFYRIRGGRG